MKNTVLVTGASRGIGRAIAQKFAENGYHVALHGNSHFEQAESLASELCAAGFDAMAVRADLRSAEQVEAMRRVVERRFGQADTLINNAGVALPQKLLTDCTEAEWDDLFAVNVRAMFLTIRAFTPAMVSMGRGSIVNLSSMWGVTGGSCEAPYSASKAAVIGLTKAMAKELAPSGVRVNCIAPGFVTTDMNAALTPETVEEIRLETPLLTLGTPEDVADAALFLAARNARFITGQVICCDGGRCI